MCGRLGLPLLRVGSWLWKDLAGNKLLASFYSFPLSLTEYEDETSPLVALYFPP